MKEKPSIFNNIRKFVKTRNRKVSGGLGLQVVRNLTPTSESGKKKCRNGECRFGKPVVQVKPRRVRRRADVSSLSPRTRRVISFAQQVIPTLSMPQNLIKQQIGMKNEWKERARRVSWGVSASSIGLVESDTSLLNTGTLATFGKFVNGEDAFGGLQRGILGNQVARATDAYDMASRDYDYWDQEWHQWDFSEYTDDYDDEDDEDDDWDDEDDGDGDDGDDEDDGTNIDCINCPGCKNCVNCVNCVDCENCQNCSNCRGCKNCTGCTDSKKCKNCRKCNGCSKCNDCKACSKCNKCSGGCSKCKGCNNCKKCSGCSGCSGGCSNCNKCKGCSGCSGCNKCSNCNNCSNCQEADSQDSISFPADIADVAITAAENCQEIMDALQEAFENGLDSLPTMDEILDAAEDALDMLTSSLQNALENTLPDMMLDIMDQIMYSHEETIRLFDDIYSMTWSENKQWVPTCLVPIDLEEGENWLCSFLGGTCPEDCMQSYDSEWMVPRREMPEYLDYIQQSFGGAIDNMRTKYKTMFEGLIDPITDALDAISEAMESEESDESEEDSEDIDSEMVDGARDIPDATEDADAEAEAPIPAAIIADMFEDHPINTSIPLMSLTKQVMDCMNNVCKLNTMIRDCTNEVLENLKSMEASELYQCCKSGTCNKKKCCGGGGHCKGKKKLICTECEIELLPCIEKVYYVEEKPYCKSCYKWLFGKHHHDRDVGKYEFVFPAQRGLGVGFPQPFASRDESGDSGESEGYGDEEYEEWDDEEDEEWDEEEDGITSEDFKEILDVLLEAEFVLSNLATVIGKIMEYFLNHAVAKFADKSNKAIIDALKVWHDVCEIVPPLDDLYKCLCAVPNNGDQCTNQACNTALPMIWNTVKQYVTPACESVADISRMCDNTTSLQYDQDAMNQISNNVDIA